MFRCLYLLICIGFTSFVSVRGQELRASLHINTQQIGTTGVDEFGLLERELLDWLNSTHWTDMKFSPVERIPCSFNLNILERTENYKYQAELVVTANRPVYNTSYTTPIALFRDKELNFEYTLGSSLETNLDNPSNNLVSVFAYYVHLILLLHQDSFSPLGGNAQMEKLGQIVSIARSQSSWQGWQAFDSGKNRTGFYESLSSPTQQVFRQRWYSYHRMGLDRLADSFPEGRTLIQECLKSFRSFSKEHFRSPLVSFFEQTKLQEVVDVFSEAPKKEREDVYKILQELSLTKSEIWSKLRN